MVLTGLRPDDRRPVVARRHDRLRTCSGSPGSHRPRQGRVAPGPVREYPVRGSGDSQRPSRPPGPRSPGAMRVEAEPRRSMGVEGMRPMTNHVAPAAASSAHLPDGLDWQRFSAASFPGRRRHDLEALTAYGAYRRSHAVDKRTVRRARPDRTRRAAPQGRPRCRTGKTKAARRYEVLAKRLSVRARRSDSRTNDQIDSRSAFAAACRRSLTSASSRAARSMRSCCASARACWLSARRCWLSARSLIALS